MSSTNDIFDENELYLIKDGWEKSKNFLEEIPFFNQLGDEKIKRIVEQVNVKRYCNGEILFRENETSQASCYTRFDGSLVQIAILRCGDFFGGKVVFNDLPSVATVEDEDNLFCLTMTCHAFQEELAPVINKFKEVADQYEIYQ